MPIRWYYEDAATGPRPCAWMVDWPGFGPVVVYLTAE